MKSIILLDVTAVKTIIHSSSEDFCYSNKNIKVMTTFNLESEDKEKTTLKSLT